tara:strand:- start:504 stop:734 length:231 start_codon:yes stop_codon:yes gene_type:complete
MTIRELFKEFGELLKEIIDFIIGVMTYVLIYLPSKIINYILDTEMSTLVEDFWIYFLIPAGVIGIISILIDKYTKK